MSQTLKKPGDRIAVESRRARGRIRSGEIAEVLGGRGHEHYFVRWDDGEQSVYYPTHHPDAPERQESPPRPALEEPAGPESPGRAGLHARPGDRLVVHGHRQGEPERDAEILEVRGSDGAPPFRVRWSDSGHESIFYPGSDAHVERLAGRRGKAAR